jgi:hypothetical protein
LRAAEHDGRGILIRGLHAHSRTLNDAVPTPCLAPDQLELLGREIDDILWMECSLHGALDADAAIRWAFLSRQPVGARISTSRGATWLAAWSDALRAFCVSAVLLRCQRKAKFIPTHQRKRGESWSVVLSGHSVPVRPSQSVGCRPRNVRRREGKVVGDTPVSLSAGAAKSGGHCRAP